MHPATKLATQQYGVISREQALALGLNVHAIRWLRDSKEWLDVHSGVYRVATIPQTWNQRAIAALLLAGESAALSYASAAHAHALEGFAAPPRLIEITVPRSRRVRVDGIRAHHVNVPIQSFITRQLRTATLAQTFVDLAETLDEERLEFALDSAQRKHPALLRWFGDLIPTLDVRGYPQVVKLRQLLAMRRGQRTDSLFELRIWRALRRSGIKPPRLQYEEHGVMRIDFAWPLEKVVLHADSVSWHAQQQRLTRDAMQRAELTRRGWESTVVTWPMLNDDAWLQRLRSQLQRRSPQSELSF